MSKKTIGKFEKLPILSTKYIQFSIENIPFLKVLNHFFKHLSFIKQKFNE